MKLRLKALLFCGAFLLAGRARCAPVLSGLDVLERGGFAALSGKRVGVICNHTAVDSGGRSLAQLLLENPSVSLRAIFTPEHGFDGKARAGAAIGDERYKNIPVYSLYGRTLRPTPEMLSGLDVLVFDIQDAGVRFYTYTATMAQAMEEADRAGIEFMVLDRPDPITGAIVEGPVLDPAINAFTAYLRVPLRHGMTPGELALYHARAKGLKRNPRIIRMSGWKRDMWYEQTGLAWAAPSPNLRTVDAAVLYPGIGCFEASNLSVGRGTAMPFEWLGAPWLDSAALLRELQSGAHPGVEFMAVDLTPDGDVYAGQPCRGVKLVVTDRNIFRPLEIFLRLFYALRKTQPSAFVPECRGLERMTGVRGFCALQETSSADTMIEYFRNGAEEFRRARSPFLLY